MQNAWSPTVWCGPAPTADQLSLDGPGMIGTKVAAAAPERVQSLTVLSSTGFGHHMVLSMLWSPLLALKVREISGRSTPLPSSGVQSGLDYSAF